MNLQSIAAVATIVAAIVAVLHYVEDDSDPVLPTKSDSISTLPSALESKE